MAFQTVPDGVEAVFEGIQNGVPIVNVYNIKDTAAHTPTRLEEIADALYEWWGDFIQPYVSDSYFLQSIRVTSLILPTGPQIVRSYTTANQGARTGGQAGGNVAAVISWRTASIGRSFRGRTYIGGLAVSELLTAQTLTTGQVSNLATAGVALIDALTAIGATLCVLSRIALGVARVTGLLTEIISVIVDNKVDSQRKRTAN